MQCEIEKGSDFFKVALLFFCITVLYFFPVIFSHHIYASRDLHAFFFPRRFFAAEALRNGIFPLWNPYLASGVPFFANLQSSVLYPLSLIYYLLPFPLGFNYFIIFHYYLAGLFMYLLMRHLGYETSSSVMAGIVFMFGGYLVSILDNLAFLTAAVWLPLIVLFFDRSLRRKSPFDLIVTGVLISLQILGGDASCYLLSTGIFLTAYLINYLISERQLTGREKMIRLSYLPAVWIVALGFSSVQLLPFFEFVSRSHRSGGIPYETLTRWSFHPVELLQLLVPYLFGTTVPFCRWFGQYWLDTLYIGVFPLLLVIFSLFWARTRGTFLLLFTSALSLFMAFGSHNPFFHWLTALPGINMLQYPVKYLFLAGFVLALLAGRGFSALFARLEQGTEVNRFFLLLLLLNSLFLVVLFTGWALQERLFSLFQGIYPETLFHTMAGVEPAFLAVFRGCSWLVLLLGGASMLLVLARKGVLSLKAARVLLIALVLADLTFLGKPDDPAIESSRYLSPSETVKVMETETSPFRIFSLSYCTFEGFMHMPGTPFPDVFTTLKTFLMPNLSMIFHLDTVDEYAALLVTRYYGLFSPVKTFFRRGEEESWQRGYVHRVLSLLNVRYLISSFRLEEKGFKLVKDGRVRIYENPGMLPRAYLAPAAQVVADDAEVLRVLEGGECNPGERVLITGSEYAKVAGEVNKGYGVLPNTFKGTAKILKYSPNLVEIETNGNASGFLVLADNFYPGWRVYLNGSERPILQVQYNLRGVFVPRGRHRVSFRYDPMSFTIGASITLCTLLASILFLLFSRKGKETQPHP